MANHRAPVLVLREGDRRQLVDLTSAPSVRGGKAQRARIVLLAAEGRSNTAIAEVVGVSRPTVITWRDRYAEHGLDGLVDLPRGGRPRCVDPVDVLHATVLLPPSREVAARSTRRLASELGTSHATVARVWRDYGLTPTRGAFRFASVPEIHGTVLDLVGIHHAPPARMIALSVRRPVDPRHAGRADRAPALPDGLGAGSLAATARAWGGVASQPDGDETGRTDLAFLERVERHQPRSSSGVDLHLVVDDVDAMRDTAVAGWLAGHPRLLVSTVAPTTSWARLVAAWLAMTDRSIRRPARERPEPGLGEVMAGLLRQDPVRRPFVWTLQLGRPPPQRPG